MPILNSIISWFVTKRKYQIDFFRQYPVEVQDDTLKKLLRQAGNTVFGREHGFSSIASHADFASHVPVRDYPGLKPYIDLAMTGKPDVLWPGEVKWFAKSSGTTGDKSKYIPVTKDNLEECHFRGGKDTLAIWMGNNPDSGIFLGKSLVVGGSLQVSDMNSEAYFGDLSAVLLQNMPAIAHWLRTPDLSIALMDEWEEKLEKMAEHTIRENVTSLAGVPSWTLILLKKVLERTGKDNIADVWPGLEVFMHGGVNFTPYRDQYKSIIRSDSMKYMETYNASEGFFGIQDDPDSNDMLLMLDYDVYFEFIPAEEIGTGNEKALTLRDIEPNRNYAMVISTSGGLWRYLIGDTIRFSSLKPVKFRITGRTKHFINAFGEELIIDNAEFALSKACQGTGAAITDYTAAPVYMSEGSIARHQWLIEFSTPPENLGFFTELLDNGLKAANSDYEAKRYKNIALLAPEVVVLRNGIFYDWLKLKGKLGAQHKVPRLSNDRTIVNEVLEINNRL
ncbi:MAG: GH3 auxin-responsive promoter family protein [Bacteroidota bacterium]